MRIAGIDALATEQGTVAVLAMDQRGTIRTMMADVGRPDATEQDMVDFKTDLISSLAGSATAFLLDPTYGMPAARAAETDAPFGILLAAEPASRPTHNGEPATALDPVQGAAWVKASGADALKFFVQMRADRPVGPDGRDTTAEALEAMRSLIADCAEVGVPCVIENLIFPLAGEGPLTPAARADAVIESALLLDDLGPTMLKLEYPGSPADCRRLADRLNSPWAVLSAGVSSDEFTQVLRVSCDEGGASGFIAGRSVWRETVAMDHAERVAFLRETGRRRFDEYVRIIDGRAVPYWHKSSRASAQPLGRQG